MPRPGLAVALLPGNSLRVATAVMFPLDQPMGFAHRGPVTHYGTEAASFPSRVERACQRRTSMPSAKNLTEPSSSEAWTPPGWKLREVTAAHVGAVPPSV